MPTDEFQTGQQVPYPTQPYDSHEELVGFSTRMRIEASDHYQTLKSCIDEMRAASPSMPFDSHKSVLTRLSNALTKPSRLLFSVHQLSQLYSEVQKLRALSNAGPDMSGINRSIRLGMLASEAKALIDVAMEQALLRTMSELGESLCTEGGCTVRFARDMATDIHHMQMARYGPHSKEMLSTRVVRNSSLGDGKPSEDDLLPDDVAEMIQCWTQPAVDEMMRRRIQQLMMSSQ